MPKRISKKVLKIEDLQLRDYELIAIISPEVAEEQFDAAIDSVSQFITEKGGTISNVERRGKKRWAYSIEHFTEGSYGVIRFRLMPTLSKELVAGLQISAVVLRRLLGVLSS